MIMKYICTLENKIDVGFVDEMSKLFNLDRNLVGLLYSRGINSKESLYKYLNPSFNDLYDPFLFEDMQKVVEKIKSHLDRQSKILIFGDYDVDGISASAILIKYFNSINANVSNFMPNRYEDGYGLNIDTLNKIIEANKPDLIITVDCGITAVDEVEYLKNNGIDIIITDHHERAETLPLTLK